MKFITILFDGMADLPDEHGETPMSLAEKPMTDSLAATAEIGLCATVPAGFKPGSDVANLSVMGYDPADCYTGRSPLEAISMGIALSSDSVTYRANLVTLSDDEQYEQKRMLDYSGGEITTAEATQLIAYLDEHLSLEGLKLYAGVSYRHCLKRAHGETGAILTPPHDISDKCIAPYLPQGKYAQELTDIMRRSYELLRAHPVNLDRVRRGLRPADSLWFWGEGTRPKLRNFTEETGLRGAVVSAVDLIKGIAIGAGLDSIDVEGATGTLATNFDGKAAAGIAALDTHDYLYMHLEAPDECGHQGDKAGKTQAISRIDRKIVTPIVESLRRAGTPFRMLILPDHATPYTLKTHTSEPVPYLLYDSTAPRAGVPHFTEKAAAGKPVCRGVELLGKLLR